MLFNQQSTRRTRIIAGPVAVATTAILTALHPRPLEQPTQSQTTTTTQQVCGAQIRSHELTDVVQSGQNVAGAVLWRIHWITHELKHQYGTSGLPAGRRWAERLSLVGNTVTLKFPDQLTGFKEAENCIVVVGRWRLQYLAHVRRFLAPGEV